MGYPKTIANMLKLDAIQAVLDTTGNQGLVDLLDKVEAGKDDAEYKLKLENNRANFYEKMWEMAQKELKPEVTLAIMESEELKLFKLKMKIQEKGEKKIEPV